MRDAPSPAPTADVEPLDDLVQAKTADLVAKLARQVIVTRAQEAA